MALWLAGILRQWIEPALGFVRLDFGDATLIAANVILFLLFVPLVYLTALFILGVFGMQKMVDHVAARVFPQLERRQRRRHGGQRRGTAWSRSAACSALFIVSLPLWLLPPLWPLIPLAILAWVNQRLLRYDALAEHADAGRDGAPVPRAPRRPATCWASCSRCSPYVPLVGFIGPVVFGLAFIRYLLGALD